MKIVMMGRRKNMVAQNVLGRPYLDFETRLSRMSNKHSSHYIELELRFQMCTYRETNIRL